jgi:hypothetical protein
MYGLEVLAQRYNRDAVVAALMVLARGILPR